MKRKRIRRKILWNRVILVLVAIFLMIYGLISVINDVKSLFKEDEEVQVIVYAENNVDMGAKQVEKVEEVIVEEPVIEVQPSRNYRLTSYYTNDGTNSGSCTGSGICTNKFQVNDKGWYTYQGKLVIAAATNECLNAKGSDACGKYNEPVEGRHYFNYFDELQIEVDGQTYDAIVLDSCGASMFVNEDRIDLFVSSKSSAIDRGYKGNNMITVFAEFE